MTWTGCGTAPWRGLRAHVTRGASDWDAARTDAALVAARERGLIDE